MFLKNFCTKSELPFFLNLLITGYYVLTGHEEFRC